MDGVILITGCNSGIGAETAKLFLEKGWKVIATINPNDPNNEICELQSIDFHTLSVDITKEKDRKKLSLFIEESFNGKLDCLINNAGVREQYPFELLDDETISRTISVNLLGTTLVTRACLPFLIKSQGRILFLSSIAGFIPVPMGSVYTACKHAVEGFAQCLSLELKSDNVQICTIQPGAHETPINYRKGIVEKSTNPKVEKAYKMARCLENKKLPPAKNVAEKILLLAQKERMPSSYRVGNDAKYHYMFSKIIPRKIWLKLHMFFLSFCALQIQPK